MQTLPWTLEGLLGIGNVMYRVEYYEHPGNPMHSCTSLVGDSLDDREKASIKWTALNAAEVNIGGLVLFHWDGHAWAELPLR